jgi:hypothetical protein
MDQIALNGLVYMKRIWRGWWQCRVESFRSEDNARDHARAVLGSGRSVRAWSSRSPSPRGRVEQLATALMMDSPTYCSFSWTTSASLGFSARQYPWTSQTIRRLWTGALPWGEEAEVFLTLRHTTYATLSKTCAIHHDGFSMSLTRSLGWLQRVSF